MRGLRYDRILAGTAVALVLAAVTGAHAASTKTTVVAHKHAKVATEAPSPPPATTPVTTTADVTVAPVGSVAPMDL
jgi:hypothetical protein